MMAIQPYMLLLLGGIKEVCELLVPKMTPEAINAADKNGNTALHAAILGGYKEVCELLISEMNPESYYCRKQ